MKALIGATFLVLVWTAFSFGGEPVPPVVPDNQVIISEQLDEVNDLLEENELTGKKVKRYCEPVFYNIWEIAIKDGVITGTWNGSYPVTGTKKGKTINMRATGLCDMFCASYYEITVTKVTKGSYVGSYKYDACPGYDCTRTGPTSLVKGNCEDPP
jgi:hypothetical protein